MKSLSKLIFPLLLLAHVLVRFGTVDVQISQVQGPDLLICDFENQLRSAEDVQVPEAVFAVIE